MPCPPKHRRSSGLAALGDVDLDRGRRARPRAAGRAASRGVRVAREASGADDLLERADRERARPRLARGEQSRSSSRSSARSLRALAHLLAAVSPRTSCDGELDQVAHHRLDVAPDVADLGELRGLDLHERRLRELGEPARDLGLPDAGRADHDDVLRRDLVAQLVRRPAAGASGCAARSPPRAWPCAGRRCSGRARRRSRAA